MMAVSAAKLTVSRYLWDPVHKHKSTHSPRTLRNEVVRPCILSLNLFVNKGTRPGDETGGLTSMVAGETLEKVRKI